uniref:Uncharacterized protein n=1 Tax=Ananas comosus var. bracteatus TaxID=296719 RepID=A0A6V7Q4Q1_ANACO|nr:unnamed protein product [Ananas comosus var. bracteatus]
MESALSCFFSRASLSDDRDEVHVLRQPLAPGGSRAWSIIYFASSWLTFLIAAACLIAGATKNAYHTKYRHVIYAQNWTCESLRKGVFIAGAVFVVFTMILNVYYYMYFTKATSQAARKTTKPTRMLE